MSTETVAAVVVTFNRKQLLTECLDALLAQTRPVDRIFIIDNASADGTPELLAERGYLGRESITYSRLPENIGGAGGFHEGMKRGHEAGFDWLWLMDDDGKPSKNALDVLMNSIDLQTSKNRAPLVVSDLETLTLTFGLIHKGVIVTSKSQISETTVDDANIFLGNLIHRTAIDCVGYPRKEMFIWGDEVEYMLRLKRHAFYPKTNVDATFYHPKNRVEPERVLYGVFGRRQAGSRLRLYCFHRNMVHIKRNYHGTLSCARFVLTQPVKYLVSGKLSEFGIVTKAMFHGIFSIWGYERRLL